MTKIRVLIADDHPIARKALIDLLQHTGECEVVGEAHNGQEAILQAVKHHPDVVLLDVEMPRMKGIEAIGEILRQVPKTRVVMISSHDEADYIYRSIQAGAKGYLLKESDLTRYLEAIYAVIRGESYLPPNLTTKLINRISSPELTEREHKVLSLLVQGLRNKEIAIQLDITQSTVKNHLAHIFDKMGVQSRSEAVSRAIKEKLVESG
jgi:two-component system, NarL family, response regulator